jgi:hypothetical protein
MPLNSYVTAIQGIYKFECGINLVQATVWYAPGGSDRKLISMSTISPIRATIYVTKLIKPVIPRKTVAYALYLGSEMRIKRARRKYTGAHNITREAARHIMCP